MKVINNKKDNCFKLLCLALSVSMVLVLSGASTSSACGKIMVTDRSWR